MTDNNYSTIPSVETIKRTIESFQKNGVQAELVESGEKALERLKELVPGGSTIMTSGSRTLTEIGLDDFLISATHPWRNFKGEILAEKDPVRQRQMRLEGTMAEYCVGGVNAMTEKGELIWASATGSQIPAFAFTSRNVIWVAGVQKIMPTLEEAINRVREYVLPLEDKRIKNSGGTGSFIGKLLIFEKDASFQKRNMHLILVNKILGF